ncbi:MAG: hypothetical protein PPP58_07175 [Natronomonas sp.]
MKSRVYRASVFALYQFSIVVGILMLPIALAAGKAGLRIPLDSVIESLGEVYKQA